MTTTIEPTVGRIVWHRDTDGATRAAIVVGVNTTFNLNLFVFSYSSSDLVGGLKDSVTHADPAVEPSCTPSWHWMPYQVEQAKRAEAKLEAMSAGSCSATAQIIGATGFGPQHERFDTLSMALRTPGVSGCRDVLAAAKAYRAYIDGEDPQSPSGAAHPGYSAMQPHQHRVVDELAQLQDRLSKLIVFTGTTIFACLDDAERKRLDRQVACMTRYANILGERIAAAKSA